MGYVPVLDQLIRKLEGFFQKKRKGKQRCWFATCISITVKQMILGTKRSRRITHGQLWSRDRFCIIMGQRAVRLHHEHGSVVTSTPDA